MRIHTNFLDLVEGADGQRPDCRQTRNVPVSRQRAMKSHEVVHEMAFQVLRMQFSCYNVIPLKIAGNASNWTGKKVKCFSRMVAIHESENEF